MDCFPLQQNELCYGSQRDHVMILTQVLYNECFNLQIRFFQWYQFNSMDVRIFIIMYVKTLFLKNAIENRPYCALHRCYNG